MKAILTILLSFGLVVSLFGQTRNVVVGTNGAIVQPTNFWSADVTNARSGLGLGSAATNPDSAFQPSSAVLSNLASSNAVNITNLRATNIVGTVALASNVSGIISIANGGTAATTAGEARTNLNVQQASVVLSNLANSNGSDLTNITISSLGTIAISNGGTGATNAATARTNLGLGWPALTNTNFASALLGTKTSESSYGPPTLYTTVEVVGYTNGLVFTNASVLFGGMSPTNAAGPPSKTDVNFYGNIGVNPFDGGGGGEDSPTISVSSASAEYVYISGSGISFTNGSDVTTRSNLGLGADWLTNTNNPVFVGTGGEVVSPTNFWQVSPANTRVQYSQPVVNATNAATNARNLYLYSLAISTTGITNTITLPTNAATFYGDVATVIHEGPTSSITAVRQTGAGTNIITLNQFQEAVQFNYESGGWRLADNLSYVEPIYFSGTNAAANAAASRTNLGLGATWLTNTNADTFRAGIGLGTTNNVAFNQMIASDLGGDNLTVEGAIYFTETLTNVAVTRTNLGLPLAALTNTNNANFQAAIFATNAAPTNSANVNGIGFNTAVAWMEVTVQTNGTNATFRIPLFR